jgi:hypothetical protein
MLRNTAGPLHFGILSSYVDVIDTNETSSNTRFEVLTVVWLRIQVFWQVTLVLCGIWFPIVLKDHGGYIFRGLEYEKNSSSLTAVSAAKP